MKNSKLDELVISILEQINSHSSDMDEMANFRADKFRREQLPQPMRIPLNQVRNVPPYGIKCVIPPTEENPNANEVVTDAIVGDTVVTFPSGDKALQFRNYADPAYKDERQPYVTSYYMLNGKYEGKYSRWMPRIKELGAENIPKVISPNAPAKVKERWASREETMGEAYAKRYAVFRAIDNLFERQDILDLLDSSLIPETWAHPRTTERTTNVDRTMKFGGNGQSMDMNFHAVRDYANPEDAIENMFRTRAAIEDAEQRDRQKSKGMPRQYAQGQWDYKQRIRDEAAFERAGKYTPILDLFKKNIQEGQKGIVLRSNLHISGQIARDQYVMVANFTCKLGHRIPGETDPNTMPRELENIINPISVSVSKPVPEELQDNPDFTIRHYPKFFFGKEDGTGIMNDLMNKLGDALKENINPEDVFTKIEGILEFRPETNVEESVGKKLVITEEQLKRVVQVVKEQEFDEAFKKFQKEKEREVYMSKDEAETLVNIALNWCQGKEGNSDCNEILRLKYKFGID